MAKSVDYIIVGQGVSGSCLAYQLIKSGYSVVVIDEFHPSSSSRVAAGIINPVTGRKLVKSWMVDELIPFAKSFYKKIEEEFSIKVFHEVPIYKLFASVAEQNIWFERSEEASYSGYLSDIKHPSWNNIETPFGVGEIQKGAWVDTVSFLDAIRKWFKKQDVLIEEKFDPAKIDLNDNLTYKDISTEKIIFCEGPAAIHNPYFKYLPFNLAKGEVMKVKTSALEDLDGLISKNGFVLPYGDRTYKVGATFKWNDYETTTSNEGYEALKEKWNKVSNTEFELLEHKAGIRPTVKDRRPFIGAHPYHSELLIFNGMGTKGVSLAPYFAKHLIDHIIDDSELLKEVDVVRYEQLLDRK